MSRITVRIARILAWTLGLGGVIAGALVFVTLMNAYNSTFLISALGAVAVTFAGFLSCAVLMLIASMAENLDELVQINRNSQKAKLEQQFWQAESATVWAKENQR
jgi:mannitol-specific phosphotransferase system IIBC component